MFGKKESSIYFLITMLCSLPIMSPILAQEKVSFDRTDIEVGIFPVSVAVGDFNDDKIQDLVVINRGLAPDYSGTISILLGNGDGTFEPPQTFEVGTGLGSVAVGDFNSDGLDDLAVINEGLFPEYRGTILILLGNGDGSFQRPQPFDVGRLPKHAAVIDRNGDGIKDLAVVNLYSDTVSILRGQGDGTFQAGGSYQTGVGPISVAVGDFDGDGVPDLAVVNNSILSNSISILLGNSDGSFRPAQNYYPRGPKPTSIAIGDFNDDDIQDLAVTIYGLMVDGHTVSVLLGNGDGTFQEAQSFEVGLTPVSVNVADFNGDDIADLAVVNSGSNSVSILLGMGDGTFQPAQNFSVGIGPTASALGDFDGDESPDLAVTNGNAHTVSILINTTP